MIQGRVWSAPPKLDSGDGLQSREIVTGPFVRVSATIEISHVAKRRISGWPPFTERCRIGRRTSSGAPEILLETLNE